MSAEKFFIAAPQVHFFERNLSLMVIGGKLLQKVQSLCRQNDSEMSNFLGWLSHMTNVVKLTLLHELGQSFNISKGFDRKKSNTLLSHLVPQFLL